MKSSTMNVIGATLLCLLIAGCNQKPEQGSVASESADPTTPEATPAPTPKPDIRTRIRQIATGDRTGIWSSVPGVCKGSRKERAEIMWHFPDAGTERVVVSFVGSEGKEKTFADGRATGLKATGPWLREGMGFVARSASDNRELGRLTIAGRDCQ